jgi:hypothetical protein
MSPESKKTCGSWNAAGSRFRKNSDIVSFLLSNGHVTAPLNIEGLTLKSLFSKYFKSLPTGSLEECTLYTIQVHRRWLEKTFDHDSESIDIPALQEYVNKRQIQKGRHGLLSPTTIRKEITTLRTVWNWAKRSKLVT